MKYKEIYRIVCSYHLEDGVRTVAFKEMLRSLGYSPILSLWETREYYEGVVKYNVERGLRVDYKIIKVQVRPSYILNQCLESESDGDLKIVLDNYILRVHDRLIEEMDMETFKRLYLRYGNDYTRQLIRRI